MSNQTQNAQNLPATPDWSKAPDWAYWFAVDEWGDGLWFMHKPTPTGRSYSDKKGYWVSKQQIAKWAGDFDPANWQNSLQQRPISTTLEMGNPNHKSHPLFAKPKNEGLKPDGVWIDEAEHFADSSEIKPPRTFSETATVYFNSEITGYLVGKNSFITGLVDLLLARMAKEERFSDDETELSYDDIKKFDVVVGETHQFHFKYMFIVTGIDSLKSGQATLKGFGVSQWRKSHSAEWREHYPNDDCRLTKSRLDTIRTINELEAVEFRTAMEAVYG